MTSASRGNASGGHIVTGSQIQPGVIAYSHLAAAAQETLAGFRDKLINGDFRIWQRGTSLAAGTGYRYCADRWTTSANGSTGAPSQQAFTLGQTAVPGEPVYFHRVVVASSAGVANYCGLIQRVEGVRSLAGQTATLSFWAKADAARNIAVEFDRAYGSGGGSAYESAIGVTTKTLTTAWQQFKVQVSIPSISGKTIGSGGDDWLDLNFWFDAGSNLNARTNNLGQQSGTFDIACVKFEAGSDVTPYAPRPIALEELLCKRYYAMAQFTAGRAFSANLIDWGITAPVMRGTPTATMLNAAHSIIVGGVGSVSASGATITNFIPNAQGGFASINGYTGLTAGNITWMSSSNVVALNAEL